MSRNNLSCFDFISVFFSWYGRGNRFPDKIVAQVFCAQRGLLVGEKCGSDTRPWMPMRGRLSMESLEIEFRR
jgi:hypothetical protein